VSGSGYCSLCEAELNSWVDERRAEPVTEAEEAA
jgi:hypothetical protein